MPDNPEKVTPNPGEIGGESIVLGRVRTVLESIAGEALEVQRTLLRFQEGMLIDITKGFRTQLSKLAASMLVNEESIEKVRENLEKGEKVLKDYDKALNKVAETEASISKKIKEEIKKRKDAKEAESELEEEILRKNKSAKEAESELEEEIFKREAKRAAAHATIVEKGLSAYKSLGDAIAKGVTSVSTAKNILDSLMAFLPGMFEEIFLFFSDILVKRITVIVSGILGIILAAFEAFRATTVFMPALMQTMPGGFKDLSMRSTELYSSIVGNFSRTYDLILFGSKGITDAFSKIFIAISPVKALATPIIDTFFKVSEFFVTMGINAKEALEITQDFLIKGIITFSGTVKTNTAEILGTIIKRFRDLGVGVSYSVEYLKQAYAAWQPFNVSLDQFGSGALEVAGILRRVTREQDDAYSVMMQTSEGLINTIKSIEEEGNKLKGASLIGYRMIYNSLIGEESSLFKTVHDLIAKPLDPFRRFALKGLTEFKALGENIDIFLTKTFAENEPLAQFYSHIYEKFGGTAAKFEETLEGIFTGKVAPETLDIDKGLLKAMVAQQDPLSIIVKLLESVVTILESKLGFLVRMAMEHFI
jgi:hypothetical protein